VASYKTELSGVVVHAFNPSTRGGGIGRQISEFEASLVYKVSSRTARATQRNPVSKTKQNKTKQNKTKQQQKKTPELSHSQIFTRTLRANFS
jgi:hypothetical protein